MCVCVIASSTHTHTHKREKRAQHSNELISSAASFSGRMTQPGEQRIELDGLAGSLIVHSDSLS